jgi:hypothetical protein
MKIAQVKELGRKILTFKLWVTAVVSVLILGIVLGTPLLFFLPFPVRLTLLGVCILVTEIMVFPFSFPGIASPEDAAVIIRKRIKLGLSQIKANEEEAEETAVKIMPDETVKAILNVSALNSHILLERTCQAIDRAISSKAEFVSPDHVFVEPEEQAIPTSLEASILKELTGYRKTED